MIKDIVPVFRVASVASTIAWYHDVLGFSADAVGPADDPLFAIMRRDDIEIMAQKSRDGVGPARSATQSGGGWDVYVRVHDAKAAWDLVRGKTPGVEPIRRTVYGCLEFNVVDPDGHVLVFGQCD